RQEFRRPAVPKVLATFATAKSDTYFSHDANSTSLSESYAAEPESQRGILANAAELAGLI
ncbi:MAG: hypothetical protein CMJ64_26355, partial [Planctomycetaceae bacterium]|nr:hypothetical protein [Planctomycetaceae bacterium]